MKLMYAISFIKHFPEILPLQQGPIKRWQYNSRKFDGFRHIGNSVVTYGTHSVDKYRSTRTSVSSIDILTADASAVRNVLYSISYSSIISNKFSSIPTTISFCRHSSDLSLRNVTGSKDDSWLHRTLSSSSCTLLYVHPVSSIIELIFWRGRIRFRHGRNTKLTK